MAIFQRSSASSRHPRAHDNHDSSSSTSPPSTIFLHLSQHLHELERLLQKGRSCRRGRLRVEDCARACQGIWEECFGLGWEHHSSTIKGSTSREFVVHLAQKARLLHIDPTGETASFVTYQLLTDWADEINLATSLLAEQQLLVDLLQTEYQANHNYTYHTLQIHRISSSSPNEYARQAARLKVELANERERLSGGVWAMKMETKRFQEVNDRYA